MAERIAGVVLDEIGGVRLDTPQIRDTLQKTGCELGLVAVSAVKIDEAVACIVAEAEAGFKHLGEYNRKYSGPPHNAGLGQLGGSALRGASDFKALIGRYIGQRLSAVGIQVEQVERQPQVGPLRPLVDRVRGLSLLALTQNWRTQPEFPETDEPEAAA